MTEKDTDDLAIKILLKDMLQDLIDLTDEIDWSDDSLQDIFEEDLRSNIAALATTLYAILGYQCWNQKD
jgi:hypothetical protein